jgi:hypothetical protein
VDPARLIAPDDQEPLRMMLRAAWVRTNSVLAGLKRSLEDGDDPYAFADIGDGRVAGVANDLFATHLERLVHDFGVDGFRTSKITQVPYLIVRDRVVFRVKGLRPDMHIAWSPTERQGRFAAQTSFFGLRESVNAVIGLMVEDYAIVNVLPVVASPTVGERIELNEPEPELLVLDVAAGEARVTPKKALDRRDQQSS